MNVCCKAQIFHRCLIKKIILIGKKSNYIFDLLWLHQIEAIRGFKHGKGCADSVMPGLSYNANTPHMQKWSSITK